MMTAGSGGQPPTIAYPYGVDGVLLRVLEAGEGPETIVLLHGLGARADRWRENIGAFAAEGFRVFALDFPGHGFSEKSLRVEHSVPSYARLVRQFVDDVSADGTATLIGTSMGGHVAATAALAEPSAFRGVVLVGPVGLRPLGAEARQAIAASIVDTTLEGIRRKLTQVLADDDLVTPEWVTEEHRINNSPGAADALGAIARYFADDVDGDVVGEDDLRALVAAVPTLFVWGAADEIIPLSIAEDVERSLGVAVTRISAAAHLPYYENPAEFNSAVVGFLRSVGAPKVLR
jgi:pimeloyl-ACP methyl ester carboxylesterase